MGVVDADHLCGEVAGHPKSKPEARSVKMRIYIYIMNQTIISLENVWNVSCVLCATAQLSNSLSHTVDFLTCDVL